MLIHQRLVINMHPNCSSRPNAHHARVLGTFLLASVKPLRVFGSAVPSGPARSEETVPTDTSTLHGLQGSLLVEKPAPWRGTVITTE